MQWCVGVDVRMCVFVGACIDMLCRNNFIVVGIVFTGSFLHVDKEAQRK